MACDMTSISADKFQHSKPLRIWLDGVFSPASLLNAYARSAIAGAMRREIARILQLRISTPSIYYRKFVEVAGGFFTVIAIEDDVYFKYYVGDPQDPLPPRPHLNPPKAKLLRCYVIESIIPLNRLVD